MLFTSASPEDNSAIASLLRDHQLPTEGILNDDVQFYVMREAELVIGIAAIEGHVPDGLLRSVAIHPAYQHQGLGAQLIEHIVKTAQQLGYTSLYLLTETASPFFERCGFTMSNRTTAPPSIQLTDEFRHVCPSSASFMYKTIHANT
jgi:amino-acid N-acetyltransferase